MSRHIALLEGESYLKDFARIMLNAYPSMTVSPEQLEERLAQTQAADDVSNYHGIFEDDRLLGGMRLLDFTMNYHGQMIPAGGVGSVAVDLLQKKRGIARQLIEYYLEYYAAQGTYLALLYPFRPDFYHKMGFGYGTKMNRYEFPPGSLTRVSFPGRLFYMNQDHKETLRAFHNRQAERKNGYCRMSLFEANSLFKAHGSNNTLVGYELDGQLKGYLAFNFKRAHENNFVRNNLNVRDWEWDSPESLGALAYFIQTQADQVERVIYNTQDDKFHYMLKDVRSSSFNMIPSVYHESNTAGVGIMYRITDFVLFLKATAKRNFNGQSLDLTVDLTDSFYPKNSGRHHLSFCDGVVDSGGPETNSLMMAIDIAELSALLMGAVSFSSLYSLGLVVADPGCVELLDDLFRVKQAPHCVTAF